MKVFVRIIICPSRLNSVHKSKEKNVILFQALETWSPLKTHKCIMKFREPFKYYLPDFFFRGVPAKSARNTFLFSKFWSICALFGPFQSMFGPFQAYYMQKHHFSILVGDICLGTFTGRGGGLHRNYIGTVKLLTYFNVTELHTAGMFLRLRDSLVFLWTSLFSCGKVFIWSCPSLLLRWSPKREA